MMLQPRAIIALILWAGSGLALVGRGQESSLAQRLATFDNPDLAFISDFNQPEIVANQSVEVLAVDGVDAEQGFAALTPRQSRCNPGYYMCSNGRCCPTGTTCVSGGLCCPGNTQRCGAATCYDPRTQICCSDGTYCPRTHSCVPGGFCCPGNTRRCGSTTRCYDQNTQICCNTGTVCAKGDSCVSGGGCCPGGQARCGSKCYNPNTQKCCSNGVCRSNTTCCEKECCLSNSYCGSNGRCARCPAETRTVTATVVMTMTRTTTRTVTTSRDLREEQAPGFSCVPMTTTNAESATLELRDDCGLKYIPPPTSAVARREAAPTSPAPVPDPAAVTALPQVLLPRQLDCTPYTTVTQSVRVTRSTTTTTTTTRTVRGFEGFSCVEMEVTNAAGDVLALDGSCVMSFSAAARETAAERVGEGNGSAPARGVSMASAVWSVVVICAAWLLM